MYDTEKKRNKGEEGEKENRGRYIHIQHAAHDQCSFIPLLLAPLLSRTSPLWQSSCVWFVAPGRSRSTSPHHYHNPHCNHTNHIARATSVSMLRWSRSIAQHHATPRSTTQHHAAPRSTTQHYAALRSTTQHYAALRSTTQHHAASRSTTQYHAASRSTTQHHTTILVTSLCSSHPFIVHHVAWSCWTSAAACALISLPQISGYHGMYMYSFQKCNILWKLLEGITPSNRSSLLLLFLFLLLTSCSS